MARAWKGVIGGCRWDLCRGLATPPNVRGLKSKQTLRKWPGFHYSGSNPLSIQDGLAFNGSDGSPFPT